MKFSEALNLAAGQAGWNATKIAAEVGVSESTAKRWLDGTTEPRYAQVQELRAKLLGFSSLIDGKAVA